MSGTVATGQGSVNRETLLAKKVKELYGKYMELNDKDFNRLVQRYKREHLLDHLRNSSEPNGSLSVNFIIVGNPVSFKHKLCAVAFGLFRKCYGPVHTCIQIGPYVLHWVDNSLVKIDIFKSTRAVLALDVTKITLQKGFTLRTDPTISKILDLVADYNMNRKYNLISCNCQDFVDDVLKILGIDDLERHLTEKCWDNDAEWEKEFKKKLGERELQIFEKLNSSYMFSRIRKADTQTLFETHKELDEFTRNIVDRIKIETRRVGTVDMWETLLEKMKIFEEKCPSQYLFLKSFDRSFWLKQENEIHRHGEGQELSSENIPDRDSDGLSLCLFESPFISGTVPLDMPLNRHPFTKSKGEGISTGNPVKVLVLCGAGLRGISILGMLERIENDKKKKIHELFDVVAGSALSGVVALAISQQIPLEEIKKFYIDLLKSKVIPPMFGEGVFSQKEWLKDVKGSYSIAGLNDCIKNLFCLEDCNDSTPISQCKSQPLFFIPVANVRNGKTYILNITQAFKGLNLTLGDAARLSVSQKQYFDSVHPKLCCAAELACNPAEKVIDYLSNVDKFKNREIVVVTLGSGRLPEDKYLEMKQQHEWLSNEAPFDVLHSLFAAQYLTTEVHIRLTRWLSDTNAGKFVKYFRFAPLDEVGNNITLQEFFEFENTMLKLKNSGWKYLFSDPAKQNYQKLLPLLE